MKVKGEGTQVMAKAIGRHIVVDPAICHGQPTFRGTRIFVADVLEQVASGMAWESIIESWGGALTKEAIAESVRLAREFLLSHKEELVPAGE
jgi:uncharacterized protein (DUF433 family)